MTGNRKKNQKGRRNDDASNRSHGGRNGARPGGENRNQRYTDSRDRGRDAARPRTRERAGGRDDRAPAAPLGGARPPVRRPLTSNFAGATRERYPETPRPSLPQRTRELGAARDEPPPVRREERSTIERVSRPPRPPSHVPTPPGDEPDFEGNYFEPSPEEAPELGLGTLAAGVRYEPEVEPLSQRLPSDAPSERDLEAQIRALEARLDGLIRRPLQHDDEAPRSTRGGPISVAPTSVAPQPQNPDKDSVSEAYVARNWGREALRSRLEDVDDFGLDPAYEERVRPGLDLLYRRYFRVQCQGIDRVPAEGRAVIVANHSGMLPIDGAMLRAAMRLDHPKARDLRWLAEDFAFYLPFAGVFINRIGAVRACPENAERLLAQDNLIAVFPEGVQGVKKLFAERYRLQRFGRGGYIRLCLRMRAPLVPCAIVGAEEANPLLYRFEWLAQFVHLPFLPVTPTFPLLGPLGLLPAPTRWKLHFGEPISFDNYGPEAANDDVLVGRLSERVRASIQGLLDSALRERKSVWFG